MHIGRLGVHLGARPLRASRTSSIDGLTPGDRPFFTAKRIALSLDWCARSLDAARCSIDIGRDDRLADARRDAAPTAGTTSRGSTGRRRPAAHRAAAGSRRRCSTCARTRGQFIVRRPRHAVEHRRAATSTSPSRKLPATTTARATFTGGTRRDPALRADVGEHAGALHDRRTAACMLDRIDLETDGAVTRGTGDVDLGALARADLSGRSRASTSRACARSSSRDDTFDARPATATSPARSTSSRAATISTGAFTSARRRRATTTGSRPSTGRCVWAPRSLRGHATPARGFYGGDARLRLPDRRRSASATRPTRALRRRLSTTSISRAHRLPRARAACGSPGRATRHATCSSGRSGDFAEQRRRRATLDGRAAAGRRRR